MGRGKDLIVQQLQQQLAGCGWSAKDTPLCWMNSGLPLSSLCSSACLQHAASSHGQTV